MQYLGYPEERAVRNSKTAQHIEPYINVIVPTTKMARVARNSSGRKPPKHNGLRRTRDVDARNKA